MANVNRPAGLSPVSYLDGSPWNGQARVYYIPSTDTNAYAIGDPVATNGAVGSDGKGIPAVTLATAGSSNAVRGVIVGIGVQESLMADPNNLNSTIIPAAKTYPYYVMVVDDPMVLFEVQEYAGNYGPTDVGKTANLKSGVNNGFMSGWQLDDTVASSTAATGQLQLMGLSRKLNNAFGVNAKWLVRINQHELKAALVGV